MRFGEVFASFVRVPLNARVASVGVGESEKKASALEVKHSHNCSSRRRSNLLLVTNETAALHLPLFDELSRTNSDLKKYLIALLYDEASKSITHVRTKAPARLYAATWPYMVALEDFDASLSSEYPSSLPNPSSNDGTDKHASVKRLDFQPELLEVIYFESKTESTRFMLPLNFKRGRTRFMIVCEAGVFLMTHRKIYWASFNAIMFSTSLTRSTILLFSDPVSLLPSAQPPLYDAKYCKVSGSTLVIANATHIRIFTWHVAPVLCSHGRPNLFEPTFSAATLDRAVLFADHCFDSEDIISDIRMSPSGNLVLVQTPSTIFYVHVPQSGALQSPSTTIDSDRIESINTDSDIKKPKAPRDERIEPHQNSSFSHHQNSGPSTWSSRIPSTDPPSSGFLNLFEGPYAEIGDHVFDSGHWQLSLILHVDDTYVILGSVRHLVRFELDTQTGRLERHGDAIQEDSKIPVSQPHQQQSISTSNTQSSNSPPQSPHSQPTSHHSTSQTSTATSTSPALNLASNQAFLSPNSEFVSLIGIRSVIPMHITVNDKGGVAVWDLSQKDAEAALLAHAQLPLGQLLDAYWHDIKGEIHFVVLHKERVLHKWISLPQWISKHKADRSSFNAARIEWKDALTSPLLYEGALMVKDDETGAFLERWVRLRPFVLFVYQSQYSTSNLGVYLLDPHIRLFRDGSSTRFTLANGRTKHDFLAPNSIEADRIVHAILYQLSSTQSLASIWTIPFLDAVTYHGNLGGPFPSSSSGSIPHHHAHGQSFGPGVHSYSHGSRKKTRFGMLLSSQPVFLKEQPTTYPSTEFLMLTILEHPSIIPLIGLMPHVRRGDSRSERIRSHHQSSSHSHQSHSNTTHHYQQGQQHQNQHHSANYSASNQFSQTSHHVLPVGAPPAPLSNYHHHLRRDDVGIDMDSGPFLLQDPPSLIEGGLSTGIDTTKPSKLVLPMQLVDLLQLIEILCDTGDFDYLDDTESDGSCASSYFNTVNTSGTHEDSSHMTDEDTPTNSLQHPLTAELAELRDMASAFGRQNPSSSISSAGHANISSAPVPISSQGHQEHLDTAMAQVANLPSSLVMNFRNSNTSPQPASSYESIPSIGGLKSLDGGGNESGGSGTSIGVGGGGHFKTSQSASSSPRKRTTADKGASAAKGSPRGYASGGGAPTSASGGPGGSGQIPNIGTRTGSSSFEHGAARSSPSMSRLRRPKNVPSDSIPWKTVLRLLMGLASGIATLHKFEFNGRKVPIAHRDIKCENVLVSGVSIAEVVLKSRGTAVLADFEHAIFARPFAATPSRLAHFSDNPHLNKMGGDRSGGGSTSSPRGSSNIGIMHQSGIMSSGSSFGLGPQSHVAGGSFGIPGSGGIGGGLGGLASAGGRDLEDTVGDERYHDPDDTATFLAHDIYCFGLVAWQLMTLHPIAFVRGGKGAIAQLIEVGGLSDETTAMLQRWCAPKGYDRPSIDGVLADLAELSLHVVLNARDVTPFARPQSPSSPAHAQGDVSPSSPNSSTLPSSSSNNASASSTNPLSLPLASIVSSSSLPTISAPISPVSPQLAALSPSSSSSSDLPYQVTRLYMHERTHEALVNAFVRDFPMGRKLKVFYGAPGTGKSLLLKTAVEMSEICNFIPLVARAVRGKCSTAYSVLLDLSTDLYSAKYEFLPFSKMPTGAEEMRMLHMLKHRSEQELATGTFSGGAPPANLSWRALRSLFTRATHSGTSLLLVIDDLQYIDSASLACIADLLQEPFCFALATASPGTQLRELSPFVFAKPSAWEALAGEHSLGSANAATPASPPTPTRNSHNASNSSTSNIGNSTSNPGGSHKKRSDRSSSSSSNPSSPTVERSATPHTIVNQIIKAQYSRWFQEDDSIGRLSNGKPILKSLERIITIPSQRFLRRMSSASDSSNSSAGADSVHRTHTFMGFGSGTAAHNSATFSAHLQSFATSPSGEEYEEMLELAYFGVEVIQHIIMERSRHEKTGISANSTKWRALAERIVVYSMGNPEAAIRYLNSIDNLGRFVKDFLVRRESLNPIEHPQWALQYDCKIVWNLLSIPFRHKIIVASYLDFEWTEEELFLLSKRIPTLLPIDAAEKAMPGDWANLPEVCNIFVKREPSNGRFRFVSEEVQKFVRHQIYPATQVAKLRLSAINALKQLPSTEMYHYQQMLWELETGMRIPSGNSSDFQHVNALLTAAAIAAGTELQHKLLSHLSAFLLSPTPLKSVMEHNPDILITLCLELERAGLISYALPLLEVRIPDLHIDESVEVELILLRVRLLMKSEEPKRFNSACNIILSYLRSKMPILMQYAHSYADNIKRERNSAQKTNFSSTSSPQSSTNDSTASSGDKRGNEDKSRAHGPPGGPQGSPQRRRILVTRPSDTDDSSEGRRGNEHVEAHDVIRTYEFLSRIANAFVDEESGKLNSPSGAGSAPTPAEYSMMDELPGMVEYIGLWLFPVGAEFYPTFVQQRHFWASSQTLSSDSHSQFATTSSSHLFNNAGTRTNTPQASPGNASKSGNRNSGAGTKGRTVNHTPRWSYGPIESAKKLIAHPIVERVKEMLETVFYLSYSGARDYDSVALEPLVSLYLYYLYAFGRTFCPYLATNLAAAMVRFPMASIQLFQIAWGLINDWPSSLPRSKLVLPLSTLFPNDPDADAAAIRVRSLLTLCSDFLFRLESLSPLRTYLDEARKIAAMHPSQDLLAEVQLLRSQFALFLGPSADECAREVPLDILDGKNPAKHTLLIQTFYLCSQALIEPERAPHLAPLLSARRRRFSSFGDIKELPEIETPMMFERADLAHEEVMDYIAHAHAALLLGDAVRTFKNLRRAFKFALLKRTTSKKGGGTQFQKPKFSSSSSAQQTPPPRSLSSSAAQQQSPKVNNANSSPRKSHTYIPNILNQQLHEEAQRYRTTSSKGRLEEDDAEAMEEEYEVDEDLEKNENEEESSSPSAAGAAHMGSSNTTMELGHNASGASSSQSHSTQNSSSQLFFFLQVPSTTGRGHGPSFTCIYVATLVAYACTLEILRSASKAKRERLRKSVEANAHFLASRCAILPKSFHHPSAPVFGRIFSSFLLHSSGLVPTSLKLIETLRLATKTLLSHSKLSSDTTTISNIHLPTFLHHYNTAVSTILPQCIEGMFKSTIKPMACFFGELGVKLGFLCSTHQVTQFVLLVSSTYDCYADMKCFSRLRSLAESRSFAPYLSSAHINNNNRFKRELTASDYVRMFVDLIAKNPEKSTACTSLLKDALDIVEFRPILSLPTILGGGSPTNVVYGLVGLQEVAQLFHDRLDYEVILRPEMALRSAIPRVLFVQFIIWCILAFDHVNRASDDIFSPLEMRMIIGFLEPSRSDQKSSSSGASSSKHGTSSHSGIHAAHGGNNDGISEFGEDDDPPTQYDDAQSLSWASQSIAETIGLTWNPRVSGRGEEALPETMDLMLTSSLSSPAPPSSRMHASSGRTINKQHMSNFTTSSSDKKLGRVHSGFSGGANSAHSNSSSAYQGGSISDSEIDGGYTFGASSSRGGGTTYASGNRGNNLEKESNLYGPLPDALSNFFRPIMPHIAPISPNFSYYEVHDAVTFETHRCLKVSWNVLRPLKLADPRSFIIVSDHEKKGTLHASLVQKYGHDAVNIHMLRSIDLLWASSREASHILIHESCWHYSFASLLEVHQSRHPRTTYVFVTEKAATSSKPLFHITSFRQNVATDIDAFHAQPTAPPLLPTDHLVK